MSYRFTGLGMPPAFASTSTFAEAVDPYAMRTGPRGAIYSPYGWGPDFMVGMPFNYTHHIDYVRDPAFAGLPERPYWSNAYRRVPGARWVGPMRDVVGIGSYEGDSQRLAGLGALLVL